MYSEGLGKLSFWLMLIGAPIMTVGILPSLINWIKSLGGSKAEENPWKSPSLEWSITTTPVRPNNFKKFPVEVPDDWHPYAYYFLPPCGGFFM